MVPEFSVLIVLAGCLGFCAGGTTSAVFSFIAERWGEDRFSSVQAQMTLIIIPFSSGTPPLIAWLFDLAGNCRRAGNCRVAFMVEAAACGIALVLLLAGVHRFSVRQPPCQRRSRLGSAGEAAEVWRLQESIGEPRAREPPSTRGKNPLMDEQQSANHAEWESPALLVFAGTMNLLVRPARVPSVSV